MSPSSVHAERTDYLAVMALSLGVFCMVLIEELPIGILTLMADGLSVTAGITGLTVTLPGYVAAVSSLAVPILARNTDRRLILSGALGLMVAASVASAIAPTFAVLLASRLVVGVSIGAFWGIAPSVALRIASQADSGRATSLVFAGASLAVVIGVPFASFLGAALGWRMSFVAVALIGLVTGLILLFRLPTLRSLGDPMQLGALWPTFTRPYVAVGVITTLVLVSAQFAGYTYASPLLQAAGVSVGHVGAFLLVGGLAGLVGNFVITALQTRALTLSMFLVTLGLAAAQLSFHATASTPLAAGVCLAAWGFISGMLSAGLQGWINRCSPTILEVATGLNAAAFNIAIASGAGVGGLIVDRVGLTSLLPVSATLAACAALPVLLYITTRRRGGAVSEPSN